MAGPGASPLFWFVPPAVLVLLAVDLGPMLYALKASFAHWVPIEPGSENDPAGFSDYLDILRSGKFWSAVRVTITYAVCSIACGLVLGTAIALALDLDFYARSFFRAAKRRSSTGVASGRCSIAWCCHW